MHQKTEASTCEPLQYSISNPQHAYTKSCSDSVDSHTHVHPTCSFLQTSGLPHCGCPVVTCKLCRKHAVDVLDAEAIAKAVASDIASKQPEPEVVSNEVRSQQSIRGLGVFTAFVDGRVRARFEDRTLIAIDRWHRTAEVVGRDSQCTTVAVRCMRYLCCAWFPCLCTERQRAHAGYGAIAPLSCTSILHPTP